MEIASFCFLETNEYHGKIIFKISHWTVQTENLGILGKNHI